MILAHHAGIKVFATGGIGGVHRAAANSMDISADLAELGRTPVAVVCSGAKPFLDIERTMEYLETAGVPAITFGKKGEDTFIPLFYSRDSRWKAEMVIETSAEAARIVYAAQEMGLESGQLFMNPIPDSHHINHLAMKDIITGAVTRCRKKGITGRPSRRTPSRSSASRPAALRSLPIRPSSSTMPSAALRSLLSSPHSQTGISYSPGWWGW